MAGRDRARFGIALAAVGYIHPHPLLARKLLSRNGFHFIRAEASDNDPTRRPVLCL